MIPQLQLHEMTVFRMSIKNCQRTAAILPEHMCSEMQLALANESVRNIFIGEETYPDIDWLFTLTGLVQPHIVKCQANSLSG